MCLTCMNECSSGGGGASSVSQSLGGISMCVLFCFFVLFGNCANGMMGLFGCVMVVVVWREGTGYWVIGEGEGGLFGCLGDLDRMIL